MPRPAPPLSEAAEPRPARDAQERKWRAEDALRTLTRAAEIRKDKALMADVEALAKQQQKTLAAITGADAKDAA